MVRLPRAVALASPKLTTLSALQASSYRRQQNSQDDDCNPGDSAPGPATLRKGQIGFSPQSRSRTRFSPVDRCPFGSAKKKTGADPGIASLAKHGVFTMPSFFDIPIYGYWPRGFATRYIGRDCVNLEALGGKRSISSVADDPGALSISMETPVSGLFGPGKSGPASIIPFPALAFHNTNDDPSISAGEFILACPPRDSSPGVEMLIKRRAPPPPSGCRADSSP